MSVFRWTSLSLMLLYLTASSGQFSSFTVRDGDQVTLPCENVINDQRKCSGTTWLFTDSQSKNIEELITLGQIGSDVKAKSDRLSVAGSCSLVLKTVTAEDAGRYTCRQFKSGQQRGGDANVYLSVVNSYEYKDKDAVTLSCSVSIYSWCTQRVTWLFKGKDVDQDNKDVKTSQYFCSANVTFSTSHDIYPSRYGLLTCQTTDIMNGKVQQFTFSPRSSDEDATTVRTTEQSIKAASADDPTKPQGWWRFVLVPVALAVLITIVVAVNVWKRD